MIRYSQSLLVVFTVSFCMSSAAMQVDQTQSGQKVGQVKDAIKELLSDFHLAASHADTDRYFDHFSADAVFLGTDLSERFSVEKLRDYARPYFSKGIGWTYVPTQQNVFLSGDKKIAWFDERLKNSKYGEVRGSGVLRNTNGRWTISQYNLTFPVPNSVVKDLVPMIASASQKTLKKDVSFSNPPDSLSKPKRAVAVMITDYHRAAATANGTRFFDHLAPEAIVLGTDSTERFTVGQLKSMTEPYFSQGIGWTSVPIEQNVFLSSDGKLAWFDERVVSANYGEMRGTGVAKYDGKKWRIVHYNTGFPIPNGLVNDYLKMIRESDGTASNRASPELTSKQTEQNLSSFDYVWTTIRDKYFDPSLGGVDWEAAKKELRPRVESADSMSQVRTVLNDLVSRLKVSHFGIIPSEAYLELKDSENSRGGVTGLDVRIIESQVVVVSVLKGSSAEEAGIKPGWEIVKIGEEDTRTRIKSLTEKLKDNPHARTILVSAAKARLRGRIGQRVSLVCRDDNDKLKTVSVSFKAPKGRKSKFGNIPEFHVWIDVKKMDRNIGYIRFNAFMDPLNVMGKFNDAMMNFGDVDGIVIDVRGNGGGMGEMAMGMIGWFVEDGRPHLGTIVFRSNQLKMLVNPRPAPYRGPVVVLIDEMSVSAAEFFASGFQDIGRAHLVGTRTAGAVLGSSIEKLPNGDGFQYAAVNYISKKSGQQLEGVGVSPDTLIPLSRNTLLQGKDPQLEAAIGWIREQPIQR